MKTRWRARWLPKLLLEGSAFREMRWISWRMVKTRMETALPWAEAAAEENHRDWVKERRLEMTEAMPV